VVSHQLPTICHSDNVISTLASSVSFASLALKKVDKKGEKWRSLGQVWRIFGQLWCHLGAVWRRFGQVRQHKNTTKPHFQSKKRGKHTNSVKKNSGIISVLGG